MEGPERDHEDEFPPRRPFGVPAGPVPAEVDEDDDAGVPPGTPGGPARRQPPATRS